MAKTETIGPASVSRSWLPPMDGGTALMAVLIGFMGFYRALPLDPDSHQQFQHRDDRRTAGLRSQGLARSVQRVWHLALAVEQRQDRHRVASDRPAAGDFHFLVARAHQYPIRQRVGVRLLDFVFSARFGHHVRLDADARSEHGIDQLVAASDTVLKRAQFRHLHFRRASSGFIWSATVFPPK